MQPHLELTVTAFEPKQLPDLSEPQVALAGRSNVGKSSLINCLAGRKQLARISSTPGKTRSLNFYQVTPGEYYLVDLPGYGYAKCSKTERAKWAKLIERYIDSTQSLRAVVLLIDARLPPQKLDLELLAFVQGRSLPHLAVLTKVDKCKQKDLAQRAREWSELLHGTAPLPFSSKTGRGRDKLWKHIRELAGQEPAQPTVSDSVFLNRLNSLPVRRTARRTRQLATHHRRTRAREPRSRLPIQAASMGGMAPCCPAVSPTVCMEYCRKSSTRDRPTPA